VLDRAWLQYRCCLDKEPWVADSSRLPSPMFYSVFSSFERLFALSRAQAIPASGGLEQADKAQGNAEAKTKKEYIDHLRVPPARKEVPLIDLLQVSRRKAAIDDFEVIPQTKGVLVMEDTNENVEIVDETEDWQHLVSSEAGAGDGQESYARVTSKARRVP